MPKRSTNELNLGVNQKKPNETLLKAEALLIIAQHYELQSESAYTLHDYF